jgi:phosphopantothenoylcysteine synthetase/decarboxylase
MSIIVTCGPSSEPIDQVRSLTNFSTGELGALLCEELSRAGFNVFCLRSITATYPIDPTTATVIPFFTNDDLAIALQKISREEKVEAVFHAAALCDYRVEKITTLEGASLVAGKTPTGLGPITMTLQPTKKIIADLRAWFPEARLVGWKYEVDGTAEEACSKALHQIEKYYLDASIANGPAVKSGFEFMSAESSNCLERSHESFSSKVSLASFLVKWIIGSEGRF